MILTLSLKNVCCFYPKIQRLLICVISTPSLNCYLQEHSIQNKCCHRDAKMTSPRLLNQDEAVNIDQELFSDYCFSVDQLMELAGNINVFTSLSATFYFENTLHYSLSKMSSLSFWIGLSCAHAIAKCYPFENKTEREEKKVLVVCGPGRLYSFTS